VLDVPGDEQEAAREADRRDPEVGVIEAPPFTRLKELKFLRDTDQIDAALYWTRMAPVPEASRTETAS
jgi:hypothetical protein